jgi:exodeoxyribonuclease VII small subunit
VSVSKPSTTKSATKKEPVRFEDALKRLEEIVTRLERGELPLEESLALYEEGIKLSRLCHGKLEEAEAKIELLMKDAQGRLVADASGQARSKPFGSDGDDKQSEGGASDDEDVPF